MFIVSQNGVLHDDMVINAVQDVMHNRDNNTVDNEYDPWGCATLHSITPVPANQVHSMLFSSTSV